jgi:signal transduction histidine kinase
MPDAYTPALPSLLPVFDVLPDPYLLLSPELVVEAVNEAYLLVSLSRREDLLGRYILDVFPENPATLEANAVANLQASLSQVLTTRQPHTMARQRYDIPAPDQPGRFLERYWLPRNVPVLDAEGQVRHILHGVFDETEKVRTEKNLQTSQAQEKLLHDAIALQRQQLYDTFQEAPAMICVLDGPRHVYQFVNPPYQALVGDRLLVGRPMAEAVPELAGHAILDLLDNVYRTGKTFRASEMLVQLDQDGSPVQNPEKHYFNLIYKARHTAAGDINGIFVFAYEVTAQVLARQQVQDLNQELATINEELRASNDEFLLANTELSKTQLQLQLLNQQLEARVAERTHEMQQALHEAEQQRELLRLQQAMLHQILEQVPAAVATLSGPEHRYVFFNEQYQRLVTGRARRGLAVAEALPEVADQGFVNLLDGVFATGEAFIGTEVPLLLQNSTTGLAEQRYVDFSYQPLFDDGTQTPGILAFIIDVTDKVVAHQQMTTMQAELLAAAQRRLLERENLYQIFEQTPAAVLLLRQLGHVIEYFNPAYGRLFPGRQLRGLTIAEAQPEAVEQGFLALLDQVFQTGETYVGNELPLSVVQPDGQVLPPRYFNFTYQAYREQGQVAGVSVFAFDATEQVLARQQREAQQAELQRIFEQAPVAIAIMRGPNLVLELANQEMTRLWGRTLPQVLGRPYFEALPDTAGQGLEQVLADVVASGTPHSITDMPVTLARAHTGQSALGYFNFIFQPLYDGDNRPTGLIALGNEVTAQVLARHASEMSAQQLKQLTEALQATNDQLTRTNTDLDTFVYTASHDLKAPIANIEGLLLALREQLPAEALAAAQVMQVLDLMQDSVARFQQTLGYLSDVAMLQLAQTEPTEPLDLASHIEAVRLDLVPMLLASGGQLLMQVADCPTVYFSPKNLRSILYNLLSNGLKYAHPDRAPVVQVRSTCTTGRVQLEVQDNGLGLTQEQQGKLFVMFQRLHTHVEGSGVGLYMVKRIVENAGGSIGVQSQPGTGTRFTITLPMPAR